MEKIFTLKQLVTKRIGILALLVATHPAMSQSQTDLSLDAPISIPDQCFTDDYEATVRRDNSYEIRATIDGYVESIAVPGSVRLGYVHPFFPDRTEYLDELAERLSESDIATGRLATTSEYDEWLLEYFESLDIQSSPIDQYAVQLRARGIELQIEEIDSKISDYNFELRLTAEDASHVTNLIDPETIPYDRKLHYQYQLTFRTLESEIERLEAAKESLIQRVENLRLIPCPTICEVLEQHAFLGEFVNRGQPLLTVHNPSRKLLSVKVPSNHVLAHLRPGESRQLRVSVLLPRGKSWTRFKFINYKHDSTFDFLDRNNVEARINDVRKSENDFVNLELELYDIPALADYNPAFSEMVRIQPLDYLTASEDEKLGYREAIAKQGFICD